MDFKELYEYGQCWTGYVLSAKDIRYAANTISNEINTELTNARIGHITVRPGPFFPKEPMVYLRGKAYKYIDFQYFFNNNLNATRWIYEFLEQGRGIGDFTNYQFTPTMKELLQTFVVIVCISEVGRGYGYFAISRMIQFVKEILEEQNLWGNLPSNYPPATTFAQDERSNWQ